VAVYLNDTVDTWYQGRKQVEGEAVIWPEFSEELCGWFGEKSMVDVVEEFNKLRQDGRLKTTKRSLKN